jgi:DNA-binding CsgD family transcriptional regulator
MVHSAFGIDNALLLGDAGAGVIIIDADGRLLLVNATAAKIFFSVRSGEQHPSTLLELVGKPAADERVDVARRVIASSRPMVFLDLWAGVAMRATVRRLESYPGAAGPVALWIYAPENSALDGGVADSEMPVIGARQTDLGRLSNLTASELRVLALIGEGFSNAEIAGRLHRAVKTVESHRASLTEKTGCDSRVQLGAMARRAGLLRRVDLPESAESPAKASPAYLG